MFANDWTLSRMFQDMERLLEHAGYGARPGRGVPFLSHATPALNIWANDDALVVTGEIPGVDPASVTISVLGDTLTITGKRDFAHGQQPLRTEEFNRSIQVPYAVDADRTEARCKDGLLTVVLHRPETEKPRKITVQAA
ncbi:MAG TPA: Hsp20/alpha crystallin family protein [Planctomycetota bacterium]|jgi:HSP20 family protein|nr:Hsp20/alpha crystallin family protein [Planctomycetota bacterium]